MTQAQHDACQKAAYASGQARKRRAAERRQRKMNGPVTQQYCATCNTLYIGRQADINNHYCPKGER